MHNRATVVHAIESAAFAPITNNTDKASIGEDMPDRYARVLLIKTVKMNLSECG